MQLFQDEEGVILIRHLMERIDDPFLSFQGGITLVKITIKRAISFFMEELNYSNHSKNTINAYASDLNCFRTYIKSNLPSTRYIYQVNSKVITAFRDWLQKEKYDISSVKRKMVSLSSFFTFLTDYGHIEKNPFLHIVNEKKSVKGKEEKVVLTIDQFEKLLDSIKPGKTYTRDVAVLCVMFCTSCRFSDAQALDWNDVNFEENEIKICRPKNISFEVLPMTPRLTDSLQILHDESHPGKNDPVFKGVRGKRLSSSSFHTTFINAINNLPTEQQKEITSHCLRKSFCTLTASEGVDLYDISKYTGHKDIETLKLYTNVDIDRKRLLLNAIA